MSYVCVKIISRKSLCGLFTLIIIILLALQAYSALSYQTVSAETSQQRCEFLRQLGYNVDEDSEIIRQTVLPTVFSQPFEEYNNLQKTAGYDLSLYKGYAALLYEYEIEHHSNSQQTARLIVHNNKIIGGDICETRLNGEIFALKSREDNERNQT